MTVKLPGLIAEKLPSGNTRYRVRVEGKKARRIALNRTPDDPRFFDEYKAARRGILPADASQSPEDKAPEYSFAWLSYKFEDAMKGRVDRGDMDPRTMKQRASFLRRLRADYGDYEMRMPRKAVVKIRDDMAATPGAANNCVKTLRAMYDWGVDRGIVDDNPTTGVKALSTGKRSERGATPWTVDDLKQFRRIHPAGSTAHLALTIFMFTACRLDDAHEFGPHSVTSFDGADFIDWQPKKKGSERVTIPLLPPLKRAIDAAGTGAAERWLITGWGRPFANGNSLGNWFRNRVQEAGLSGLSPHGIRKAAGVLMAQSGVSQYQIMAVHGHTQAKTSEIYTAGVNRAALARDAMSAMSSLDW